jgi:hypothetical protein
MRQWIRAANYFLEPYQTLLIRDKIVPQEKC